MNFKNELEDNAVVVPKNPFGLTDQELLQLQEVVNPMDSSQNHGIDLYKATVEFFCNLYNIQ